jgi:hypothetical protein
MKLRNLSIMTAVGVWMACSVPVVPGIQHNSLDAGDPDTYGCDSEDCTCSDIADGGVEVVDAGIEVDLDGASAARCSYGGSFKGCTTGTCTWLRRTGAEITEVGGRGTCTQDTGRMVCPYRGECFYSYLRGRDFQCPTGSTYAIFNCTENKTKDAFTAVTLSRECERGQPVDCPDPSELSDSERANVINSFLSAPLGCPEPYTERDRLVTCCG